MTLRKLIVSTLAAAVPSVAAAAAPPSALQGDALNGQALFRLHCASCHGTGAHGDGYLAKTLTAPRPSDLRNPTLLLQRGDAELFQAIAKGGQGGALHNTMPGFQDQLGALDTWDIVAFLRRGQPTINDFFPETARYTAKTFTLGAQNLKRLERVLGKLSAEETKIAVVTAFAGAKSADGAVFVPYDPRLLDVLKPKKKLGYLTFVAIKLPWAAEPVPMSLALDREGFIKSVQPSLESLKPADRDRASKLLASFVNYGGKAYDYEPFKAPKVGPKEAQDAAEVAKAFTRAYYRALEGALMFDKDEEQRHWAD